MDPVLTEASDRITSAVDHLKVELSSIRAGRANPSLVENLAVDAYGAKMKLIEVGTISAPQPNLLTVQVWDPSLVAGTVQAIQKSDLGLSPSFEGQIVRLPIPPLTEERRVEYIKLVHQKMEVARIEVRQIRQDIREGWQKDAELGEFGEDEFDRRSKILQELIDKTMNTINELGKRKEAELAEL